MTVENLLVNKRRTAHNRIKAILSLLIIIVMIAPSISAHAEISVDHEYPDMFWKNYPYHPPGTDIVFPTDEGSHDEEYTLVVGGDSQQDSKPMKLAVDMDCLKQPLIVGGDGFLDLGGYDFSFYYSLTKLTVTGSIIDTWDCRRGNWICMDRSSMG